MTIDDFTRRKPSHIATLRHIHEKQRVIDRLLQPLVEQALAEVGNDPDATYDLIKQRVHEHAEIQQAILDLEVTRRLREQMIAKGWNPADEPSDSWEASDIDDASRQGH